jgi:hypothetical protein
MLKLRTSALPLAIAALVGGLVLLYYPLRPSDALLHQPLSEDAFYVLSISRNIAEGHGITYERGLPTNGFQPLIAFLYVPGFVLFGTDDPLPPLRWVYGLNVLLHVLGGLLAAGLAVALSGAREPRERRVYGAVAATLWISSFFLFGHTVSGLEAGLSAVALGSVLLWCIRHGEAMLAGRGIGQELMLGLLVGLAVLSRIDAALLAVSLSVWLAWRLRSIRPFFTIGFVSFLVSSPWWVNNQLVFGSIMPQSGLAESAGRSILDNMAAAFGAFTRGMLLQGPPLLAPVPVRIVALALWVIALPVLFGKRRHFALAPSDRVWLWPYAAFCSALLLYYVLHHGAAYFFDRYMMPVYVIWTPLVALLLVRWARERGSLWPGALLLLYGLCGLALHVRYVVDPQPIWTVRKHWQGLIVAQGLTPEDVVGANSMGAVGYLHRNVVNLDGKMDLDALKANLDQRLPEFIINSDIEYLVDSLEFEDNFFGVDSESGNSLESPHFERIATFENTAMWRRIHPESERNG